MFCSIDSHVLLQELTDMKELFERTQQHAVELQEQLNEAQQHLERMKQQMVCFHHNRARKSTPIRWISVHINSKSHDISRSTDTTSVMGFANKGFFSSF